MAKKILIGLGVFLLVLIIALFTLPLLFKDKINEKIKEEINNQLNAKVDYSGFDISIIRTFPNFSFTLDDFSVVGTGTFKGDTLAYIKNFNFTIDLMSVINGQKYKLLAINIINPQINAKVNYDGKANWDITKPSASQSTSSSGSSNFSLEIKKYKIENGEITYDDKKGNSFAQIHQLNFEGSGDVTQDIYDLATKTSIAGLTYKSGAVPYLSSAKLDAEINLSVDNKNSKYTFKENSVSLNDLGLQFDGYVAMPKNGMDMDVKFNSKKTEFRSILSLIPAIYKKDFDKVKTSGSLTLNGHVNGHYEGENYPAINLNLRVDNGMFQYPDLPVAVKNIYIASLINKPQGSLDKMVVDVSKLHLEAGTDPIDGKINVQTPISDPNVAASITGRMDLANVPKLYPMEGLKTMTGILTMALDFKAKKSDVDKKNYQAIKASGNVKVSNLVYDSKDVPMPVRMSDMQMTFNPQNVVLNNLSVILGKSDLNATGKLQNFMDYFFGKGSLSGDLTLKSNTFDANEWLQKDNSTTQQTAQTPDTAKTQFFKVPANIDFTANSQFGKIYYEKMVLEDVKGKVIVRDETIDLSNLSANLLGGNALITATYSTKKTDHPVVNFSYNITNFDLQQTYKTVGMAEKMAPVIKYVQGSFSSNLKGDGKLNPDMSVDYNSLNGDGKAQLPDVKVVGVPMLAEITRVAKIPALQNLEVKNAWTVIKFKGGRVYVDPTDFKLSNGFNLNVSGSNGFDQSLDYDLRLDVP
ncbi:MAG TPA: AsmA-like C-terminal region-containing protein, partial [Chitinophagales bacterium]|nr:AsmA-like C-terminal region-containing protein [Chitinophagales bacterium]